uniref:Uncharacterized protein n=1 Tax=Arundo donax TaxID=35708 RepID=A0A0A9KZX2_ARUDO
MTTVRKEVT